MTVKGVPLSTIAWPRMFVVAAETLLPENVAEQSDIRTARPVVFSGKCATEKRLHPERAEEILESRECPGDFPDRLGRSE